MLYNFQDIIIIHCLTYQKMEDIMSSTNKAKIRLHSYAHIITSILVVGVVIANVMMFQYIYKQIDQVGTIY